MLLASIVLSWGREYIQYDASFVERSSIMGQIRRDGIGISSSDEAGFVTDGEFHRAFEHDPKLLVGMVVARHFSIRFDHDPVRHEFATGHGLHRETFKR